MPSQSITPYLIFGGRCEEAIAFYSRAIGARLIVQMRYNESPTPAPDGMLQAGFEHKIMHATLEIGNSTVMASDGCNDKSNFEGFQLAFACETEAEAKNAFDALADGGSIQMPLSVTFWSPCFGMLTDRFNVVWMIMVPGVPPE